MPASLVDEVKRARAAIAGGWKDVGTLLTCYTAADDETVLAVMSEGRKVRDAQAVQ